MLRALELFLNKNPIITIAVDFDGTLCTNAFPNIGEQKEVHKKLLLLLKRAKRKGAQIILYTCRENGKSEGRQYLSEAIKFCNKQGLFFDAVNESVENFEDFTFKSRKPYADIYIDDKSYNPLIIEDTWKYDSKADEQFNQMPQWKKDIYYKEWSKNKNECTMEGV